MSQFFQEETPTVQDKKKGNYEEGKSYISYSQYKQWNKCPASWKFDKIDKLGKFEGSISTIFGTAIHEALQDYLSILFTKGSIAAQEFDYLIRFKEVFLKEFKKETERGTKISIESCKEHIEDGKEILNYLISPKNVSKYFSRQEYELVGIELELDESLPNNVKFKGFIDLVLREKETGKYKIFDIKTSKNGWNKYQKADLDLLDQVLLYKKFYSDRFNVKLSDIEVQFFILKRELYENVDFPQTPIQVVKPLSNKNEIQASYERLETFVKTVFHEDGRKRTDIDYPRVPGKNKKNCKFCIFSDMKRDDGTDVCDKGKNKI